MKIPNELEKEYSSSLSLARIVSEDSQHVAVVSWVVGKSSKDS